MIHTDGRPTIANGAGDTAEAGFSKRVADKLTPETGAIFGRRTVEEEWDYAASAALRVFADGLEEIKAAGGTLTFEQIIEAAREVSEKVERDGLNR